MFYGILFLAFIYLKIARVRKKEEIVSSAALMGHRITVIAILSLLAYGLMEVSLVVVPIVSLVFFIIASLAVTAVQLGIFVDGKPLLGLTRLYRYLPAMSVVLVVLIALEWVRFVSGL